MVPAWAYFSMRSRNDPAWGLEMIVIKLLDAARIEGYYPRLLIGSILVGIIVAVSIVLLAKPFGMSIHPALAGVMGGVGAGIFASRLGRKG